MQETEEFEESLPITLQEIEKYQQPLPQENKKQQASEEELDDNEFKKDLNLHNPTGFEQPSNLEGNKEKEEGDQQHFSQEEEKPAPIQEGEEKLQFPLTGENKLEQASEFKELDGYEFEGFLLGQEGYVLPDSFLKSNKAGGDQQPLPQENKKQQASEEELDDNEFKKDLNLPNPTGFEQPFNLEGNKEKEERNQQRLSQEEKPAIQEGKEKPQSPLTGENKVQQAFDFKKLGEYKFEGPLSKASFFVQPPDSLKSNKAEKGGDQQHLSQENEEQQDSEEESDGFKGDLHQYEQEGSGRSGNLLGEGNEEKKAGDRQHLSQENKEQQGPKFKGSNDNQETAQSRIKDNNEKGGEKRDQKKFTGGYKIENGSDLEDSDNELKKEVLSGAGLGLQGSVLSGKGSQRSPGNNLSDQNKYQPRQKQPEVADHSYSPTQSKKDDYTKIGNFPNEATQLGDLIQYHITNSTPIPLKKDVASIATIVLSILFAGGSLALYVEPTMDFAEGDLTKTIGYLISVLGANFGVTAYATSQSIKSLLTIPEEVAGILSIKLRSERLKTAGKVIGFGAVSVASAVPFALATQGDLWGSPIPLKVLVAITNAVANFYAVNNLMFEHACYFKHKFIDAKKSADYHKLLAAFSHCIDSVTYELVKNTMLTSETLPRELSPETELDGDKLLKFLAQQSMDYQIEPELPLSGCAKTIKALAGASGTGLVLVGMTGYILKVHENLMAFTSNDETPTGNHAIAIPVTGALSVPFLYLTATFGAKTFFEIADVLSCRGKKPLAMQLYPKTTIATMFSLALLCGFSFATSVDLIKSNAYLQENETLSHTFTFLAAAASIIFNNFANQKLGFEIIEFYARRCGSTKEKELANFAIAMKDFKNNVNDKMFRQHFVRACETFHMIIELP